jgi:2-C-methyl-D-erythritol 4-phosphate cytidylyltransferase
MKKTIQAQAVRGLDTPKQDDTNIVTVADAATLRAEALFDKLYNLAEIVKLAAFAVEARRTLTAIHDTTTYRPEMRGVITNNVPNSLNWSEMTDNAGDVLNYAGGEIDKVSVEFTDTVYSLARAAKNGGAA